MNRSSAFAAVAVLLLMCAPARAQSWEASGLIAYTPSVDLERVADELDRLAISGGFSWGAQEARFFSLRWGAEVLWMRQQSALEVETADGSADLFTLTADQLHGNAIYRFAAAGARV